VVSGGKHPTQGVHQQPSTQAAILRPAVHRKPGDHAHRDRELSWRAARDGFGR